MTGNLKYEFSGKIWQYAAPGGWYFVSLPEKISKEIRTTLKSEEEGWGRLKTTAAIGSSQWKTAIWFDTKKNTYLLPVKGEIRKKEQLEAEKTVKITLWF